MSQHRRRQTKRGKSRGGECEPGKQAERKRAEKKRREKREEGTMAKQPEVEIASSRLAMVPSPRRTPLA